MKCCGKEMRHEVVDHPNFGLRHEYKCPNCRRLKTCKTAEEDNTQIKVQAGAGKKVQKWY